MWKRYLMEEGEEADGAADPTARAFAARPKVRRVTAWLRRELAAAATRYVMTEDARRKSEMKRLWTSAAHENQAQ